MLRENIEMVSNIQQRPLTTMGTISSYADQDTEGETVLIGDEEPIVSTSQMNSNTNRNLTSRSPTRNTKLLQHNKHKAKKSPNV